MEIYQINDDTTNTTLIKFINSNNTRTKKRLVLLIDISGSMQGERINLVLHAIKVIITACNQDIEISIFTFDSSVNHIKTFTMMTEENKLKILDEIPKIPLTFGSTNLLGGISESLKYISSVNNKSIDTHLLVFTDGIPDNKKIVDYEELLIMFFGDSGLSNVVIDLFGFGTSLEQSVMTPIYQKGKGIFGFISDPNMLATVFNNYIANLFLTSINNVFLTYEIDGSDSIEQIYIGNMISGQERNIILNGKNISFASLTYTDLTSGEKVDPVVIRYESIPVKKSSRLVLDFHELRMKLCEIMKFPNMEHLIFLHREYSTKISDYSPYHPDYLPLRSLLDDMIHTDPNKGQIEKAFINYQRWGRYYLMSLSQSHFNEITINFKDESIKNYSGHIAFAMAAELNNIFASIPLVMTYGQRSNYQSQPVTISASSYVNQSAGCFIGNCKIQVYRNGNTMLIKLEDLVSGDILYRPDSNLIVKHILKSQISVEQPLYKYNNLIGTEKHPVKINDVWFYMKDIGEKYINDKSLDTEYVYTISVFDIKENKYIDNFIVENFQCATIGHGYFNDTEDTENILRSTFWGKTIIEIFEKISSNNNILTLMLGKYHFLRDETTGWTNYLILEE
jgi:uncharacterized protein YegL